MLGIVLFVAILAIDYRKWRDFSQLVFIADMRAAVRRADTGRFARQRRAGVVPGRAASSSSRRRSPRSCWSSRSRGYCHQHRGDLDAWRLAVALVLAGVPMALVYAAARPRHDARDRASSCCGRARGRGPQGRCTSRRARSLVGVAVVGAVVERRARFKRLPARPADGFLTSDRQRRRSGAASTTSNRVEDRDRVRRLAGAGLFKGRQTKLGYVPEQHTDFIFTVGGRGARLRRRRDAARRSTRCSCGGPGESPCCRPTSSGRCSRSACSRCSRSRCSRTSA